MVVLAGNPIISSPNGKRLDQAFSSLDFMVSIDFYLNETSRHADIILPPTGALEQSHFDLVFNTLSVRNVAKYSSALFKPEKNTRHDWQIMSELTRRLNSRNLQSRLKAEANFQFMKQLGPDGLLDILLRLGPYGTQIPGTTQVGTFIVDAAQDLLSPRHPLRKLLDIGPYGAANRSLSKGLCVSSLANYPHGVDLGSLQSSLPGRLYTANKHIKLAPSVFLKDMSRLRRRAEELADRVESKSSDQLLLIGRRHVRSNNSWMHNSYRLVKGKNRCTLLIHPDDAKQAKLRSGDLAQVSSRVGSVQVETEITHEIMPGVISIPHGWGHHRTGIQLSTASKRPGISMNDLTDDTFVDLLSGTSVLNGVLVSVCKVAPINKKSGGKAKPASASSVKRAAKKTAKPAKTSAKVRARSKSA